MRERAREWSRRKEKEGRRAEEEEGQEERSDAHTLRNGCCKTL